MSRKWVCQESFTYACHHEKVSFTILASVFMVPVLGFEPTSGAYKAPALTNCATRESWWCWIESNNQRPCGNRFTVCCNQPIVASTPCFLKPFYIIVKKHHFGVFANINIRLFFDFLKKLNHCWTGFEILFKVFIFASGVVIFAPFDYVFHFVSPFLSH